MMHNTHGEPRAGATIKVTIVTSWVFGRSLVTLNTCLHYSCRIFVILTPKLISTLLFNLTSQTNNVFGIFIKFDFWPQIALNIPRKKYIYGIKYCNSES